jgi:alpha-2-macroglobulin
MVIRAVLHNTTAQTGEAVVRVQIDGTATAAETEKKINLGPNASVSLDFPVEFVEAGEARWVWRADFAAGGTLLQDSVESKFKVGYPTPLLREIRHTRVDAAESDLLAGVDPALLDGKGVVRVSLSNSRMFELREGVNELLHYPYGCVEQTTSALLPWVALRDFRNVLPELNRSEEEFSSAINRGVARILSMQTGTGGLAYWPGGGEPQFWASAYGALGLATAKNAGAQVPESDLVRLTEYLSKQLRGAADSNDKWELSSRAFACYALALAGQPEAAYHEVLFKKRAILTQETRAFLALAILESKGPAAMADTLLKMRDKAVEADAWFGSVSRAQGARLLAWSRLAPKSDGTMAIANALFDLRKNGHWLTTQGNAWAVLGLAEYIRRTEADRKEVKGTLMSGDQKAGFQLASKGGYFEKEFPLGDAEALKLANPAKGRLFTQVKVEARPKTLVAERADRGYAITRRYQKINDDGSLSELGEPQVGDRVLVTIRFNAPTRASYVAIDDPLPAVFEGVNPEFKTQQMNVDLATVWQSDFTEIRDDRALFFRNELWEGNHEIRYLARVRAAGTATAPPTKIEEMYNPERFGLSGSQVVKGTAAR